MKKLLWLLLVISIGFVSCNGRKSKNVALKESIAEFNQNHPKIEMVTFYPKEYTEIITDTLISNKVNVRIKNYSLPNDTVVMSFSSTEAENKLKLHRVFESEITIATSNKTIFNGLISAAQFKVSMKDAFWNNATLQHAWVNQELSTSEHIQVDVSFINPKEKSYKLYRIAFDANGRQRINLIEENS